jgi:soluble lytic murein transglycosylase-like protein
VREPTSAEIASLAAQASRKYNVPLPLITRVLGQETGGLKNRATAVSPAGAVGVAQIMPETGRDLGLSEADLRDPVKSIDGAARYLRQLLDRYHGDWKLALAGYNAGPGAVQKYGGVPPYTETQTYIQRR